MVQAVREQTYLTLDSEDETSYTRGPARMIEAAIGFTLELSQAIQATIRAERDYQARRAADDRLDATPRLLSALSLQIGRTEDRLDSLSDASHVDDAEKQALQEEHSILKKMAKEFKLKRTAIKNNMDFQGDNLRELQANANALLEEAWTGAQILEPNTEELQDPPATSKVDSQAEYLAFRQKRKDSEDFPLVETSDVQLDIGRDYSEAHVDPEAEAKADMIQRLQAATWPTWERLQNAQAQFDSRGEDCYHAQLARQPMVQNGEQSEDATSEGFDIWWHQYERELTQELIDAEAAYAQADAEATRAVAVDPCDGDHDGDDHHNDGDDGLGLVDIRPGSYSDSDQDLIASASVARIQQWLSGTDSMNEDVSLQDPDGRLDFSEVYEWSVAELVVGDNMSQMIMRQTEATQSPHPTRIDEWQEIQQELRLKFEAS